MKHIDFVRKRKSMRVLALMLAFFMTFSLCGFEAWAAEEGEDEATTRTYGDYTFTKISNPTTGSGEADGINTNDESGFPANRLNSYAWAVASRGNYIYIGTNRTLFGSALNALGEKARELNPNLTEEKLHLLVTLLSGGDVPVDLEEKDFIPQIIRFDVENGTTKVIYQPQTAVGEGGKLYYTDKDGTIIPEADVTSETASFRSVVEYKGNLYFGSLGTDMLQLVRVDEDDNAEVVYQTIGLISSLRAGTVYDPGDGETLFYGGQDTTYAPWIKYRREHLGGTYPLPIVIRYLDPATAGSAEEDWSGLIADYNDFGKYAYTSVYAQGGGTVWDLCDYNGKLYLILAYEGGWAMFSGEKGGAKPNQFGWTWTEIVGDNGKYPLAMNSEVAELNAQYAADYGCAERGGTLNGTGLLESTATPYVYNGKMYIGTFDNATMLQSQTINKILDKLGALKNIKEEDGDTGPTFEQIYAPFYEALTHPQHVWVMDEDENITAVDGANDLLANTTNDYVWRYIEYDGKLYTGTFDSSSAYNYFVDLNLSRIVKGLKNGNIDISGYLVDLSDGSFVEKLKALLPEVKAKAAATINEAVEVIQGFVQGIVTAEELQAAIEKLAKLKEIDWDAIITEAKIKLSAKITEVTATTKEKIAEAEELAKTALASAKEEAAKIIAEAKELADELVQAVQEESDEKIEEVKKKAQEMIDEAKKAGAEKLAEAKKAAQEMIAKAKEDAQKCIADAKAKAEEKIAAAKKAAEEKIKAAEEAIAKKAEELANWATDLIEKAKKWVNDEIAALKEKIAEAKKMIAWLLKYFDIEGIQYLIKVRSIVKNAEPGFDLMVTEDGENWTKITGDGLEDIYNYGARTFTVCNDELYLGTTNPYYGAQLWKVTENNVDPPEKEEAKITKAPTAKKLNYNGSAQALVTAGTCEGGTLYYALGTDAKKAPAFDGDKSSSTKKWSTAIPKATKAGTYYVWYKAVGDSEHKDTKAKCLTSTIVSGKWVKTSAGWKYQDVKGVYVTNQWLEVDGKWYYFDKDGIMEQMSYRKGWYLTNSGAWDGNNKTAKWKKDSKGWWYSLPNGSWLKKTWKKIDGVWYYFKADGYMAAEEYVDGYRLNPDGAWTYQPKASWKKDSKGWYYSDSAGWYAKSQTLVIDGKSYTFDASGYLKE